MAPRRASRGGLLGSAAAASAAASSRASTRAASPPPPPASPDMSSAAKAAAKKISKIVWAGKTFEHISPAKVCLQCEQTTRDKDRDSEDGSYLVWSKTCKDKHGVERPAGEECYKCFDTRRRHFAGLDMHSLQIKRGENREVDDKFVELRICRVRGSSLYKASEQVDIKNIVERTKETFNDRYHEGTFTSLEAFCRLRNLDYEGPDSPNFGTLLDHIQNTLSLTLVEDPDGVLGVEVLDHQLGAYRFRRGAGERVKQIKAENYASDQVGKDCAKDRFDALSRKRELDLDAAVVPRGSRSPTPHGLQRRRRSPTRSPSGAPSLSARTMAFGDRGDGESSAGGRVWRHGIGVRGLQRGSARSRSRSGARSDKPTPQVKDGARRRSPAPPSASKSKAGDCPEEADCDELGPKKRRTHNEVVIESASALLQKVTDCHTWQGHWEGRMRKREFESLCSRLGSQGRKCGALLSDDAAADLSQRLFAKKEEIEARQEVFDRLRYQFPEFVNKPLDLATYAILQDAPSKLLGSIFASQGQALVERCCTDTTTVGTLCIMLKFGENSTDPADRGHASLSLLGRSNIALAEQSQRGIVLSMADKVLRAFDAKVLQKVGEELAVHLPEVVDFSKISANDCTSIFGAGWFAQPLMDLHCLRVVCMAAPYALKRDTLPRSLRVYSLDLGAYQSKLSSRLKALFKPINGAVVQHGRVAWEYLCEAQSNLVKQQELCGEEALQAFKDQRDQLQAAADSGDWKAAFNFLVDMQNEHEEEIGNFVEAFGADEGDAKEEGGDDAAEREVACSLTEAIFSGIGVILGQNKERCVAWAALLFSKEYCVEGFADLKKMVCDDSAVDPEPMLVLDQVLFALDLGMRARGSDSMAKQLRDIVGLILEVYEAWISYAKTADTEAAMRAWSGIYLKKCAQKPLLDDTSDLGGFSESAVAICADLAKAADMGQLVLSFVEDLLGENGDRCKRLVSVCKEGEQALPPPVSDLISVAATFDSLEDLAGRLMGKGVAPGLLEMNAVLADLQVVKDKKSPLLVLRKGINDAEACVVAEWRSAVKAQLDKCSSVQVAGEFLSMTDMVEDAVGRWSFEKCDWLASKNPPDELESLAKRVQELVLQFPTTRKLLERVSQRMAWAQKIDTDRIQETVSKFSGWQDLLDKATHRLATMMLTSEFLLKPQDERGLAEWTPEYNGCLKFVAKTLGVKTESLPSSLRELISQGGQAPPGQLAAQGVAAASSGSSGKAAPPTKSGGPVQKKRKLPPT